MNKPQGVAPLDDVTVVEVANYVAAPSAAAILADLGANVIRVEPLEGDPWRGQARRPKLSDDATEEAFDYDYQFAASNRGKRSITVDLTLPEGQAVVQRLVAGADVFLCNLLLERQQRFGLDPTSLQAANPRLVHATLTGYGTTGPEAWRPGYDVTAFFGRSGLYDGTREGPEGGVPMARPAQGDHTAGLALFGAIMAGLRMAERTGEPQVVETSLYETAVWTLACDFSITAVDRAPVRKFDRYSQILATANRFPCGDGKWVVVNMPQPSAWEKWCRVIGREEWLDDERFVDMRSRFRNMRAIVEGTDEALSARTRDEWGEIFDKEGVIWGPVLSFDEVVDDAQAAALELFPEIDSGRDGVGSFPTVRAPIQLHGVEVGPRGPAPEAGADTWAVLAAAGFDETEVADLANRGVIGG